VQITVACPDSAILLSAEQSTSAVELSRPEVGSSKKSSCG
jgi:hypothetical protein